MGHSLLSIADFERAMTGLFRTTDGKWSPLAETDFDMISQLLDQVGKSKWSCRPRTYAVLRMIDRIDLLDSFILEGLKDIAFPYTDGRLPNSLTPAAKVKFLQAQGSVLTKASDLEKIGGRHRHLDEDADTHFHIIKILGRGGFGEVHHVRSKLSLEEYARKRVHRRKAFAKDKEAIRTFENELANLKRLSHRHLVELVGSYTDPKYVGLLMSPVADCDLKVFLERNPFPKDDLHLLRGFFGCLCSAVLYLHNSKCRHKDLKPGNILVHLGNVLITDFGTARDWSELSRSTTTGRSSAYTPGYAAPEVVHEEPRRSSADIWSLGCVYLDMMTVLKGETLASKDEFFAMNGTGGANPRSNIRAFELWLTQLSSKDDQQPIEWIKEMIKKAPNERITAAGLMEQIHEYEDGHVYYNSCCNGEEESEDGTSYQGSIFEDASEFMDSQNFNEDLIDDGVANREVPIFSQSVKEESVQAQQLPLRLLSEKGNTEHEAIFENSDAAAGHAAMDSQAHQPLLDSELDIYANRVNTEDGLLWAASEGLEALLQQLLDKGVDVKAADAAGETALHRAAKGGHVGVARLLMDAGAFVDAKDHDGHTAIYRAAENQHQSVVQLLTERGAVVPSWMQQQYSFKQFQAFEDNWNNARFTNFSLSESKNFSTERHVCVYAIQLSGNYLVTAGRDNKIRIWNVKTGALIRGPLEGHTASVLCVRFKIDEQDDVMISAGSDASFIIWEFPTGELIKRVDGAHESSIGNLSFDENFLVTGSKDKLIKVWNRRGLYLEHTAVKSDGSESGYRPPYSLIRTIVGHAAGINSTHLDKNEIISGSGDRTIKIWSLATGECLRTIVGHSLGIACVQLDGRHIVSCSSDCTVRIFDRESGKEEHCLIGHNDLVRNLHSSLADNRIVSASYDGTVIIWRQDASGKWVVQHRLHEFNAFVAASSKSTTENPVSPDQLLKDVKNNRILGVQFDSRFLVCCTEDNRITGWDFSNGHDIEAEIPSSHSDPDIHDVSN